LLPLYNLLIRPWIENILPGFYCFRHDYNKRQVYHLLPNVSLIKELDTLRLSKKRIAKEVKRSESRKQRHWRIFLIKEINHQIEIVKKLLK